MKKHKALKIMAIIVASIVLFMLMMSGAMSGVMSVLTGWLGNGLNWLAMLPFKPFVG